jgi:3-hydroxymyristoyl/3-hydroxydecanoyl-(acyl carrier protein) dehydratase
MGADKICVIDPGHPAIAGHFAGDPVVPGVVILTELMAAVLEGTREGIAFTAVPRVKFLSPLRPGETFDLYWERVSDGVIAFTCTTGGRPVAMGRLAFRPKHR